MSHVCDVLVVGGGVLGASIAFHLARQRPGRVVLAEKSYLGAGASGKAAALVYQAHPNPALAALARRSMPVFEHFGDLVGGPPLFWRTGMVQLMSRDREAEVEERLARQRELGIEVARITDEELTEVDPGARLAEDEVAVFERAAGYVEPVQVVASFAEAARRAGAEVRQGVEVRALRADRGRVIGALTNEGAYECGRLVLATGAWAAQLPHAVGVELPVRPGRAQVALFRRPADSARRGAVFADFVQGLYLRPGQGDLIHAGDLHPPADADVDPDAYNEAADADWLPDVRQRLVRRYPAMHCGFGRGGYGLLTAATPDGQPVLDALPGLDGAFCAAGFGTESFLLSPLVGQILAHWAVGGPPADVDVAPFGLARFAGESGVRSQESGVRSQESGVRGQNEQ